MDNNIDFKDIDIDKVERISGENFLIGESVKIEDILNEDLIVTAYKELKSKYKDTFIIIRFFKIKDEEKKPYITKTGSKTLKEQCVESVNQDGEFKIFRGKIVKIYTKDGRMYYAFR